MDLSDNISQPAESPLALEITVGENVSPAIVGVIHRETPRGTGKVGVSQRTTRRPSVRMFSTDPSGNVMTVDGWRSVRMRCSGHAVIVVSRRSVPEWGHH